MTFADPHRVAAELIGRYGLAGAGFHAAARADEALDAGDLDGRTAWARVLAVIAWMEAGADGQRGREALLPLCPGHNLSV